MKWCPRIKRLAMVPTRIVTCSFALELLNVGFAHRPEMRIVSLCPAGGCEGGSTSYCKPAMFFSLPADPLDRVRFPGKNQEVVANYGVNRNSFYEQKTSPQIAGKSKGKTL
jgi:hypothetical protein